MKIKTKIRRVWDTAVSSELKGDDCTPDGTEDEAAFLPEALHHLKEVNSFLFFLTDASRGCFSG